MKMRRGVIVEEHLDDHAEEPADLGHSATLRLNLLRTRYRPEYWTSPATLFPGSGALPTDVLYYTDNLIFRNESSREEHHQ
jgi:hypothetical protein